MLEESNIGSKDLAASREHASRVGEESSNKRSLEGGEDCALKKALRQDEQEENQHQPEALHALSVVQLDQPNNQHENGSDSTSLINQLGRELTISCLAYCSRIDYGNIALLNKSFNALIKSGQLYKIRRSMGIIEHWIYFSCSLLEWEAFDPIHCRWKRLPRMLTSECFMCSDKESLAVGTELLVFGKEIQSHIIYRYSILTNEWTSGMKMNTPRCLFGSASAGGIGILAGGCDINGKILNSVELYNSDTRTWSMIPSMNTARKMCSGVFMDGKFYVIGGIGPQNGTSITSGEVYDLETKKWREIPNMCPPRKAGTPIAIEAPPLVAVVNNEMYAVDHAEREVLKYHKEKNEWSILGKLPGEAASMNGWGLAFRACGDRLIVIGAPITYGGGMIELNSWVPNEGPPQWNVIARKRSGSFVYNCAVMGC
ncbi:F-box/kelch-repeat protein SKIP11-like [Euphorbia lathyris]|uniref:F-box/kelch-repeat protein SKIP11-like n=1 Tax=Euphorbia lathyris TaxID=212925 RepID=UPI003313746E